MTVDIPNHINYFMMLDICRDLFQLKRRHLIVIIGLIPILNKMSVTGLFIKSSKSL